jgi:hypothetical protein
VEKELVGWDVRKSPLDGKARLPGQLWSRRTQDGLGKPKKAEEELLGLDHVSKRRLDGKARLPGQLWSRRTQDGLGKPEKAEEELLGLDHVSKRRLDGEARLPGQLRLVKEHKTG